MLLVVLNGAASTEISMAVPKKTKNILPCNPAIQKN